MVTNLPSTASGDPFGASGKESAKFWQFRNGGMRQGEPAAHGGGHLIFTSLQGLQDGFDHILLYIALVCKGLRHNSISSWPIRGLKIRDQVGFVDKV